LFDGRIAEDFKLSTGTWVSVGSLRARFIDHFAPYVRDVVFAGADRDDIAALVFPDIEACRKIAPDLAPDAAPVAVLDDRRVRVKFADLLNTLAAMSPGSSTRVERAILMAEPPSMDKGEMTDKGSINQRAVLKNRAQLVDELYATARSPRIIAVKEQGTT
jgi:feruloyl-CoA synthase